MEKPVRSCRREKGLRTRNCGPEFINSLLTKKRKENMQTLQLKFKSRLKYVVCMKNEKLSFVSWYKWRNIVYGSVFSILLFLHTVAGSKMKYNFN